MCARLAQLSVGALTLATLGQVLVPAGALAGTSAGTAAGTRISARPAAQVAQLAVGDSGWSSDAVALIRSRASRSVARALATPGGRPNAAALVGSGSISGVVTAADTKGPLAGIEVCVSGTGEPFEFECELTNAGGEYAIAGLPAGEYDVEFFVPEATGLNYQTQFYNGKASFTEAEPVTVAEGANTGAIDAALSVGGEIEGHVSESEGKPVGEIEVCAARDQAGLGERCALTNPAGEYAIAGLAGGEYQVEFTIPPNSELNYAKQFYKGVTSRELATPVPVTAGGEPSKEIDAVLGPGGSITGTVISATTKAPLAGVLACALNAAKESERCASTDAAGGYVLRGLDAGSYKVVFLPVAAGETYLLQFFDGKASEAEADAIEVKEGSPVAGIDAALEEAPAELPVPLALTTPAVLGSAIEGQTLSFTQGTWTNSPTSVTDEWGRCGITGAINTCFTIATTPTYTLTAEDVGNTIRIREKAANASGPGAPSFSRATAVVVRRAGGGGSSGGSGAATGQGAGAGPGAPSSPGAVATGSSGVSSEIARAATTAQLKSLLISLLVPRGKGAKLAVLHARGGYVATFNALAAGRLSIAWYLVPKGAHLSVAKPKPLLVAAGKLTAKASGAMKLTIKLTAAGRALLAKGKPLKLTAKGAFAPSGRPTLKATRSFTLKP